MNLGPYLRMLLTADAGVAALVGDRVFTEVLPQAPTVPAVVFAQVAGDEDVALDGPTGVGSRRVQIDAWAKSRAEATALALAVRAALAGHSGAAAGFEVHGVFLLTERWDFEPETSLYRTSQDYEVWTHGVPS